MGSFLGRPRSYLAQVIHAVWTVRSAICARVQAMLDGTPSIPRLRIPIAKIRPPWARATGPLPRVVVPSPAVHLSSAHVRVPSERDRSRCGGQFFYPVSAGSLAAFTRDVRRIAARITTSARGLTGFDRESCQPIIWSTWTGLTSGRFADTPARAPCTPRL